MDDNVTSSKQKQMGVLCSSCCERFLWKKMLRIITLTNINDFNNNDVKCIFKSKLRKPTTVWATKNISLFCNSLIHSFNSSKLSRTIHQRNNKIGLTINLQVYEDDIDELLLWNA